MPNETSVLRLLEAIRVERAALAKAAMLHAREHAPAFNMVELLGPGETALSGVFRWMLDERASHGQGAAFRDLFFAMVMDGGGVDWVGSRASCEAPTADGRGRIDLLVESRDRHASIAIENKPWADWQPDQLARYLHDQRACRSHARVHALIGGVADADAELARHWTEDRSDADLLAVEDALPDTVTASGFDTVADWIEACAGAARPDRVRGFLFALARYCRTSIMMESAMTDPNATATLILSGGAEAIRAAREIQASLPFLARRMTELVAERVGGTREQPAKREVVRVVADGVPLALALFAMHTHRPWIGVTEERWAASLNSDIRWGRPEKLWRRWVWLDQLGEEGSALSEAAMDFDLDRTAELIPAVIRRVLPVGTDGLTGLS